MGAGAGSAHRPASRVLANRASGVISGAFSHDGSRFAAGCLNGTVVVWDVASGRVLASLESDGDRIRSLAFDWDGDRLTAGGYRAYGSPKSGGPCCSGSPYHMTGGVHGVVARWSLPSGLRIFSSSSLQFPVRAVASGPAGNRVAALDWRYEVKLLDASAGTTVRSIEPPAWIDGPYPSRLGLAVTGVDASSSASGREIVALGRGAEATKRFVVVWDLGTGTSHRVDGSLDIPQAVALNPEGTRVLIARVSGVAGNLNSGVVELREVPSGRLIREYLTPMPMGPFRSSIHLVAFIPGDRFVAAGVLDGTVIVWDFTSGRILYEARRDHELLRAIGTRGGKILAVTGRPFDRDGYHPIEVGAPGSLTVDTGVEPLVMWDVIIPK